MVAIRPPSQKKLYDILLNYRQARAWVFAVEYPEILRVLKNRQEVDAYYFEIEFNEHALLKVFKNFEATSMEEFHEKEITLSVVSLKNDLQKFFAEKTIVLGFEHWADMRTGYIWEKGKYAGSDQGRVCCSSYCFPDLSKVRPCWVRYGA